MKISIEQFSAQGDKKENQDYKMHIINDDYSLFVVADGLGGGLGGGKASRYFCMGLVHMAPIYTGLIARYPEETFSNWIEAAVDRMGVLFSGDVEAQHGHTTCAILFIQDDLVMTAHCGDTRIYRLGNDGSLWRTKDHSIVQMLVDQKVVEESEMGQHPMQNKLTRSVSLTEDLKPEIEIHRPVQSGETFVICTDGVWEYVKQSEMLALADPKCNKNKLIKLMKTAYLRAEGVSDNLTMQWIRLLE